MHGYTYSNNNPITFTDPSGLRIAGCEEHHSNCHNGGPLQYADPEDQQYHDQLAGNATAQRNRDYRQTQSPHTGQVGPQVVTGKNWLAWLDALRAAEREWLSRWDELPNYRCSSPDAAKSDAGYETCGFGEYYNMLEFVDVMCNQPDVTCAHWEGPVAGALAEADPSLFINGRVGGGKGTRGRSRMWLPDACAGNNSFPEGTEILMADGTHKAIDEVVVGDRVVAVNPETGDRGTREVVATIIGQGRKDLVEISIDTDGPIGDATDVVTATSGHPFWVSNRSEWTAADRLRSGDALRIESGETLPIVTVNHYTQRTTVYNLTVSDIHTYYVIAGAHAVLVHNAPPLRCRITSDASSPLLTSKTVWSNKDKTMRVDIENPSPGAEGAAGIHVQFMGRGADPGKYYYKPLTGEWISESNNVLPPKVAKKIPQSAIDAAYKYLGIGYK